MGQQQRPPGRGQPQGYLINPLVNVLLGIVFLRERLRPGQTVAVIIAMLGVGYLTFNYGRLPWIALTLAGQFGVYGLLRKTARRSIEGVTLEMALLFVPSMALLAVLGTQGVGRLGAVRCKDHPPAARRGAATAIPLLLFTYGARRRDDDDASASSNMLLQRSSS